MTESTSVGVNLNRDVSRFMLGTTGLIALAVGVLILIWPEKTAVAAMVTAGAMVGIWAIVSGVLYLGTSLFAQARSGWGRVGYALLGVLFIVGGIVMLSNILLSAITVTILLGVTVGLLWIIEAVFAFSLVKQSENKVLTVISGILGLIAGVLLLLSPLYGAIILWWVVGISLVALGVVQVIHAFSMRK